MAMVVKYNDPKVPKYRHFFTLYSSKYNNKLNFLYYFIKVE